MKLLSRIAFPAAVALAVLATGALSGAQPFHMRVQVPFSFLAGDQMHPAGAYSVSVDQDFKSMSLRAADDARADLLPLGFTPVERRGSDPGRAFLRFQKLGDSYVLRGVWGSGMNLGYQTRVSARERELAKRSGGTAEVVAIQEN
jgi:hypothetical protein